MNIPFSILDLATVTDGGSPAESFRRSVNNAILAESLGYTRYWFAEHHNMASVASSATSLLIGKIAGETKSIRVGSGGIMLPNHSPLIVAEQFGTLESLYPGRIDLGLGRAPGSDAATSLAIRGANINASGNFAEDILQLQKYFFCVKQYFKCSRHSRRRARYTNMDFGLQHRQRISCRIIWIALCICKSFCTRTFYRSNFIVPQTFQTI